MMGKVRLGHIIPELSTNGHWFENGLRVPQDDFWPAWLIMFQLLVCPSSGGYCNRFSQPDFR